MNAPEPKTVGYIIAGAAALYAVYLLAGWLDKTLGIGEGIKRTSEMLDRSAENYGAAVASEESEPRTKYNAARSAYAKSIGWSFVASGYALPGWPTFEDWLDGDGPDDYTYGSGNYSETQGASVLSSLLSVF